MTALQPLRIAYLGLSLTSARSSRRAGRSRALMRELVRRGHDVALLERGAESVRDADVVIVESSLTHGIALGDWVQRTARGLTTFFDSDTPATLRLLAQDRCPYLAPRQVSGYELYLTSAGGPIPATLESEYGSPCARPFFDCIDPEQFQPLNDEVRDYAWDLGYLRDANGADDAARLERLLVQAARHWSGGRFVVAGGEYPAASWPRNVERIAQVPLDRHRAFQHAQRYTLDISAAGAAPSVRLLEAAACGTAIIGDAASDVLRAGSEMLVARHARDVIEYLVDLPDAERRALVERARARVLAEHTAAHRALELEQHVHRLLSPQSVSARGVDRGPRRNAEPAYCSVTP